MLWPKSSIVTMMVLLMTRQLQLSVPNGDVLLCLQARLLKGIIPTSINNTSNGFSKNHLLRGRILSNSPSER